MQRVLPQRESKYLLMAFKKNLKKTEEEFKNKGFKVSAILGAMEDASTREALLNACPKPDILINNSGGPPEIFLIGVKKIF